MPQSGFKLVRWKVWGLRALAVVLALLIFLIARQPISEVRIVGVPVEYINIPAGLELTGDIPQTVSVRLKGPRDIVRGLPPSQLAVEADLHDKAAGERNVPLRTSDLNLPTNVEISRVEPASLRLKLEPTLRKKVKVEMSPAQADEGFEATCVVEPELVEIEGPASVIANVTSLKTESLSLKGHHEPFVQMLEIEFPHNGLRLTDVNASKVKVSVAFEARSGKDEKHNQLNEVKVKR
jgi:YbbR domain-containing protein